MLERDFTRFQRKIKKFRRRSSRSCCTPLFHRCCVMIVALARWIFRRFFFRPVDQRAVGCLLAAPVDAWSTHKHGAVQLLAPARGAAPNGQPFSVYGKLLKLHRFPPRLHFSVSLLQHAWGFFFVFLPHRQYFSKNLCTKKREKKNCTPPRRQPVSNVRF